MGNKHLDTKMNFNSDFKYDLEYGILEGESWLHQMLTNKTIEVKSDRMAHITGNVFIEFRCRGKLSGISTTQADYWCYKFGNEKALLIGTNELKELLKELYQEGKARIINGGDNNLSVGLLVKITDLCRATIKKQ